MDIRVYEDADLPVVAGLYTESVHGLAVDHYDAEQRLAWAPREPDLHAWRERLHGRSTLLAEIDGEIAGFLAYAPDGYVDLLFTAPAHARKGVASALYLEVESRLVEAGVTVVTTAASLVARPFFEQFGFRIVEEQDVERGRVRLRRYVMRKSIAIRPSPESRDE